MSVIPPVPQAERMAKKVIVEAVKFAVVVGAVLSVLAALLPQLHVPAADSAIITAASGAVAAFLKWVSEKNLAKAATDFLHLS